MTFKDSLDNDWDSMTQRERDIESRSSLARSAGVLSTPQEARVVQARDGN